jgi:two-component system, NtrC family, nitrogen regulation response regulator GlnG
VVTLSVPPLRERLDDLPMLAAHLSKDAKLKLELNEETQAILRSYAWPGNVRELKNVLFRMATLGGSPDLAPASMSARPPKQEAREAVDANEIDERDLPPEFHKARESMIDRFEQQYLKDLLSKSDGNVSHAARTAGIARGHLYRLLKKHGLASR